MYRSSPLRIRISCTLLAAMALLLLTAVLNDKIVLQGSIPFPKKTPRDLSIVIPLTIKDLDRFLVSFSLLKECFDLDSIEEVILVVPDREARVFNVFADSHITVLPESQVIGEDVGSWWPEGWSSSWELQMLIKLQIHSHIRSSFYLLLDADVLPLKHMAAADFFDDKGRARVYTEPIAAHISWWNASKKFLNISSIKDFADRRSLVANGFGVTPAVLSKDIGFQVVEELKRVSGEEQWEPYMLRWLKDHQNETWTEFTLYRMVASRKGLFDTYHFYDPIWLDHPNKENEENLNLYDKKSLWWSEDLKKQGGIHETLYSISKLPEYERPLFLVVQSTILEIQAHDLAEALHNNPLWSPSLHSYKQYKASID